MGSLGHGSCGKVMQCIDKKTNAARAIKIVNRNTMKCNIAGENQQALYQLLQNHIAILQKMVFHLLESSKYHEDL